MTTTDPKTKLILKITKTFDSQNPQTYEELDVIIKQFDKQIQVCAHLLVPTHKSYFSMFKELDKKTKVEGHEMRNKLKVELRNEVWRLACQKYPYLKEVVTKKRKLKL